MTMTIGIRREDKSEWERRTPMIPRHVKHLHEDEGLDLIVQSSKVRVFPDRDYRRAGATVSEDLYHADLILAVKEIPKPLIENGKVYAYFAHVIKGQQHNMPMLQAIMERGCTLIDFEKIVDRYNRRLVFFGRHAGIAGMVETLWALGRRFMIEGIENPFDKLWQPYNYHDLAHAKAALGLVADRIRNEGIPPEMQPLVIGVAGYGNVSRGAQEILDVLPVEEVEPTQIIHHIKTMKDPAHTIVKTVFREEDMVRPRKRKPFGLYDYYEHPENYEGIFDSYLPLMTVLVNCVYWDEKYPRLLTKAQVKKMYGGKKQPKLRVVGDISCDIDGGIEVTEVATQPDRPHFVWDVKRGEIKYGVTGQGPVIMSVDNLPCEMPRESSSAFSEALFPFLPVMARADYSAPFNKLELPEEIKGAVVVHKGKLTPKYEYLAKHL